MWENIIGKCSICKMPILIDEEYKTIGERFEKEYICEHCSPSETKCPICDNYYGTKEEAQECFKGCAGLNH